MELRICPTIKFVEKISLQADPYSKADKSLPITYELIISFPKESWL